MRPAFDQRSVSDLLPPSGPYWRDASPIPNVPSVPNLRHFASNPSLHGSYIQPHPDPQTFGSPLLPPQRYGIANPFDSPIGSDYGSPVQAPLMPPMGYLSPQMGITAPRNSVMSNLAGMAGPDPRPEMPNRVSSYSSFIQPMPDYGSVANLPYPGHPNRMSTWSLATMANPFQPPGRGPAPQVDNSFSPSDEVILDKLRHYMRSQDLMTV